MSREIEILLYRRQGATPFAVWLTSLTDPRTVAVMRARLNRIRLGNLGDCRSVGGGVQELRIDYGPGLRIYFGRRGAAVVILLWGGNKKSQSKDIALAQEYWRECKET